MPKYPQVYNRRGHLPVDLKDMVKVDRSTKWGNPFSHLRGTRAAFKVETRLVAVRSHYDWLFASRPDLVEAAKVELKGKNLVCWCEPLPCHADNLLMIANGYTGKCYECGGWETYDEEGRNCTVCG